MHDFKESIDNYQKSHALESLEIKNAVSTAEKYAKALTTNQNTRGEFGEDWIEQIFKFSGLCENVHYTKQFVCGNTKPDFVVNLPDDKHVIIDSKVILKNFLEYCNSDNDENLKKAVVADFTKCINELAKKNIRSSIVYVPEFLRVLKSSFNSDTEDNSRNCIINCYVETYQSIMGIKNSI